MGNTILQGVQLIAWELLIVPTVFHGSFYSSMHNFGFSSHVKVFAVAHGWTHLLKAKSVQLL